MVEIRGGKGSVGAKTIVACSPYTGQSSWTFVSVPRQWMDEFIDGQAHRWGVQEREGKIK